MVDREFPAKPTQNAEASRQRILAAALAEFSAYGLAGARMDRIAKRAECNKNLVYIYFESKESLFRTVLENNLARIYKDIDFQECDLPRYAGRMFDYAMENPDLMRLMAWCGLEGRSSNFALRSILYEAKLAALSKAQEESRLGQTFSPGFLLTAIRSLATSWTAVNPFGSLSDGIDVFTASELRAHVVEAVRLLTSAGKCP